MASRILALIIWAAVAASLAYWGLRWLARPTGVPANATPVALDSGMQGDLRRLLVGPVKASGPQVDQSAGSALAQRLKLLGVVAPRQPGQHGGVALLSIDGKPPRAIRVGTVIDGEMVLQSLTQRGASIGPAGGPAAATLDLPLLPPPATGALPPPEGVTRAAPPPPAAVNPPSLPPPAAGPVVNGMALPAPQIPPSGRPPLIPPHESAPMSGPNGLPTGSSRPEPLPPGVQLRMQNAS